MAKNIALNGDTLDDVPLSTPAVTAVPSVSFFTVDGKSVITNGATVDSHGVFLHASAMFTKTGFFFQVDGQSVIIDDETATCGHTINATGFLEVSDD